MRYSCKYVLSYASTTYTAVCFRVAYARQSNSMLRDCRWGYITWWQPSTAFYVVHPLSRVPLINMLRTRATSEGVYCLLLTERRYLVSSQRAFRRNGPLEIRSPAPVDLLFSARRTRSWKPISRPISRGSASTLNNN